MHTADCVKWLVKPREDSHVERLGCSMSCLVDYRGKNQGLWSHLSCSWAVKLTFRVHLEEKMIIEVLLFQFLGLIYTGFSSPVHYHNCLPEQQLEISLFPF